MDLDAEFVWQLVLQAWQAAVCHVYVWYVMRSSIVAHAAQWFGTSCFQHIAASTWQVPEAGVTTLHI
jgi:hypothetical protein